MCRAEFPAGYGGAAVQERLAPVLDPELDESILDLGFVRSLELRSGPADVALRLPTSRPSVGVRSPLNRNSTNITGEERAEVISVPTHSPDDGE